MGMDMKGSEAGLGCDLTWFVQGFELDASRLYTYNDKSMELYGGLAAYETST